MGAPVCQRDGDTTTAVVVSSVRNGSSSGTSCSTVRFPAGELLAIRATNRSSGSLESWTATRPPAANGAAASLGANAIAVIGLFNMMGTWISGWLGGHIRKKHVLSGIYVGRSLVILAFIHVPVTEVSVLLFAAAIGLLWLGTVPLTSGIVAQIFGPRYMATLYGVVFLSHQLGSFSGVWLGGLIYDRTGSYDMFWWLAIGMGFVAAFVQVMKATDLSSAWMSFLSGVSVIGLSSACSRAARSRSVATHFVDSGLDEASGVMFTKRRPSARSPARTSLVAKNASAGTNERDNARWSRFKACPPSDEA